MSVERKRHRKTLSYRRLSRLVYRAHVEKISKRDRIAISRRIVKRAKFEIGLICRRAWEEALQRKEVILRSKLVIIAASMEQDLDVQSVTHYIKAVHVLPRFMVKKEVRRNIGELVCTVEAFWTIVYCVEKMLCDFLVTADCIRRKSGAQRITSKHFR